MMMMCIEKRYGDFLKTEIRIESKMRNARKIGGETYLNERKRW